jgi:hypothetical protein
VRVPEKGDLVLRSFAANGNLIFDENRHAAFHGVRARSHEEISEKKSVKLAALALGVVAIFQVLDWIFQYVLKK